MLKQILSVALAFAVLCLAAGCSSSKAVKKDGAADNAATVSKDKLQPVKKDELTPEELDQVNKVLKSLEDVPFDYDSYTIPTEGLEVIKANVAVLNEMLEKRGKYIRITIEGHADERGSDEYNLALGERRAKTVRDYLLNVGLEEKQLRIISFGEEKPKVDANTPEAWAANRRAHFVVE